MSLRVAVQMDPIHGVNIESDTTFLMMLTAQERGHSLWFYTPDRLSLEDGRVFARAHKLEIRATQGDHATLGPVEVLDLVEDVDVILMRQDPPFDMHYITATHLLERVHPKTLVVNNPAEVRNAPEKLFVTGFPGVQPPTLITGDREAIYDFRARHGDVVLKPLHGLGGLGVVRLKPEDPNLDAMLELHGMASRDQVVVQKFVPAVSKGDKRILLIDGEPVGGINRVPAEGQVRSNLARGGTAHPFELTARDKELCAIIGPELKARGLLFVGIDVIGDYMTEINVTSPTGAQQLKRFTGIDATAALFERIEALAV